MAEVPWLTIIGLGEDGPEGLPPASRAALEAAEIVIGPPRHLGLLPLLEAEVREWPVPFADGLPHLWALRGRNVAVLVSGDPFWFGAGSTITHQLDRREWRALPGPSAFSLAAARLGWPLETTTCLGLHAAPLTRLRPHLAAGARVIVLVRNGAAVRALADYLVANAFAATALTVMEALGGARERLTDARADALPVMDFTHPVCVAMAVAGNAGSMPLVAGLPDAFFDNDGQLTKQPVRALTLSALAPRPRERLWDIGGGSGSIAIEWLLAHPTTEAISIEQRADRAERIRANADRLGVDRLHIVTGSAPEALRGLAEPAAVFIGGGLSETMLTQVTETRAAGTRLVANAVTLETEALLTRWQDRIGGDLLRMELSQAQPLGRKRSWRASYPVVQWSVTL